MRFFIHFRETTYPTPWWNPISVLVEKQSHEFCGRFSQKKSTIPWIGSPRRWEDHREILSLLRMDLGYHIDIILDILCWIKKHYNNPMCVYIYIYVHHLIFVLSAILMFTMGRIYWGHVGNCRYMLPWCSNHFETDFFWGEGVSRPGKSNLRRFECVWTCGISSTVYLILWAGMMMI